MYFDDGDYGKITRYGSTVEKDVHITSYDIK